MLLRYPFTPFHIKSYLSVLDLLPNKGCHMCAAQAEENWLPKKRLLVDMQRQLGGRVAEGSDPSSQAARLAGEQVEAAVKAAEEGFKEGNTLEATAKAAVAAWRSSQVLLQCKTLEGKVGQAAFGLWPTFYLRKTSKGA